MSSLCARSHRDFFYQPAMSRELLASPPEIRRPKTYSPNNSSTSAHSSNPHISPPLLHSISPGDSDQVDCTPSLAVDRTASAAAVVPGCSSLPAAVVLPQDSILVVDGQHSLVASLAANIEAGRTNSAVVGSSRHLGGFAVGRRVGSWVVGRLCGICLTC